ncbi:copper chaperone PCu(A)C [Roseobacter weihaiensis]|uniref:copper chaperone PCu(A)C n=1 Tax=Roseobacter weihaiensis TaxID=2763262 RepID=UPI001D099FCB|nr:copper chaperone PCu(A)C [Roseobacter sp. H9]
MLFPSLSRGACALVLVTFPVFALAEIVVTDPYARASRPNAPTGAAFMMIQNTGETADRLISASSDIAERVELHTHIDQGDGIMKMVEVEEGFPIAPGETHMMVRGGDHVMFMGLNESLEQGGEVVVTLTFEQAGDVVVTIPVDNERQPDHGAMDHGATDHSTTN